MTDKTTLLYVDDEEINLFVFKELFSNEFNVITANSGEEGLKKITEYGSTISAVISDMRMTGMNGVEFIKRAKTQIQNTNFFILSGYDSDIEIEWALKEGLIKKLFNKPFNANEIKLEITGQ